MALDERGQMLLRTKDRAAEIRFLDSAALDAYAEEGVCARDAVEVEFVCV